MRTLAHKGWTVAILLSALVTTVNAEPPETVHVDETLAEIHRSQGGAHQIVDLTHSFNRDTIYWPTETGFNLARGPAGITERSYYCTANRFAAAEHGGSLIDSPVHFQRDR